MSLAKMLIVGVWSRASDREIHVRVEKTRLAKKLSKIKEEQGLMAEAADLIQIQLRLPHRDCTLVQLLKEISYGTSKDSMEAFQDLVSRIRLQLF